MDHQDALNQLLNDTRAIEKLLSVNDVNCMNAIISKALLHLPGPVTPQKLCRIDCSSFTDWKQIATNEFSELLNEVIRLFDSTWPVNQTEQTIDRNLLNLFSIDHSSDFIRTSISTIFSKSNTMKFEILVRIFEHCIQDEKWLVAAFIDLSYIDENIAMDEDHFIQLLVTAPNRIANHYMGKHLHLFDSEQYSCVLVLAIVHAIYFIAEENKMQCRQLFNANFLGQLLGRIAIDFNNNKTSKVLPKVFEILSIAAIKSHEFEQIIQQMVFHFPRNSLNICAWYILNTNNSDVILGNTINSSTDWKFILQTKLPLTPISTNNEFIQHLIQYLSNKLTNEECFDVLQDVMKAWSSKTSINAQSFEHHIYQTKFIILGTDLFHVSRHKIFIEKSRLIIHNGVKNHMESLNKAVRAVGMITAEIVLNKFTGDSNDEGKLKFEYDDFPSDVLNIVNEIRSFNENGLKSTCTDEYDLDQPILELYKIINEIKSIVETKLDPVNVIQNASLISSSTMANVVTITNPSKTDVLDSDDDDDDLEAYDMSNDKTTIEEKSPRYLNDLRDILLETDDPDIFEQSMKCSAALITERLPNDLTNIGIDLLRLFIGLERRHYMENFEYHRLSACVALCCIEPKKCSEYLCQEIHTTSRYSIATKILMLDILSESAKELSKLSGSKSIEQPTQAIQTNRIKKLIDPTDDSEQRIIETKKVISDRIQKKTRRFAHPTADIFKNAKPNKFADVAGDFFFPLVYGFGKEQFTFSNANSTMKHDMDDILLLHFLDTISTITFVSQNCPIVSKIAPEVFQLSSILRFHSEPKVRLAVLQMIAAALIATPKIVLQTHFTHYLNELQLWLEEILSWNIIKGEKNVECREMAKNVLALCFESQRM